MVIRTKKEDGGWQARCFRLALILLLFSTVSVPIQSAIHPVVNAVLGSFPGISVVESVDGIALTQSRYSDLLVAIPVSFLLLVIAILGNGKRVLRLRIGVIAACFILFACVAGVSACVFHEYIEAAKIAIYVLTAIALLSFDEHQREGLYNSIIKLCLVMGTLNAVVTIWQYGSISSWSFDMASIRLYRPDGLFGDSIISALFCAMTIAVIALIPYRVSKTFKTVLVVLCLMAGVVTGSRTFYYLLGIIALFLLFARTRDVPAKWKAVLVVVAVVGVAIVASPIGQSMLDGLSSGSSSSSGRDLKREIALEQFTQAPIFGIGTDQYANVEASIATTRSSGLHGTNPHNVYLQVLCENGLVGFIPFAVALISFMVCSIKHKKTQVVLLMLLYLAAAWSLGILYSTAFTSFFVALITSLYCKKVIA